MGIRHGTKVHRLPDTRDPLDVLVATVIGQAQRNARAFEAAQTAIPVVAPGPTHPKPPVPIRAFPLDRPREVIEDALLRIGRDLIQIHEALAVMENDR